MQSLKALYLLCLHSQNYLDRKPAKKKFLKIYNRPGLLEAFRWKRPLLGTEKQRYRKKIFLKTMETIFPTL